jgi:hypothetical protein
MFTTVYWLLVCVWCGLGCFSTIFWLKKLGVAKDGVYTAIQFAFIVFMGIFGPISFVYMAFLYGAIHGSNKE